MPSVRFLEHQTERLFKEADKIQDKWKQGEATEKELRKMNLLYAEASGLAMALEVIDNLKLTDDKSYKLKA